MRSVFVWLMLCFATVGVEAAQSQSQYPLIVSELSVEDGLSQSSVYDIFQDSYGFVWVATESGINRYDGHTFEHFDAAEQADKAVTTSLISSVSEDVFKKIWIGSAEGIHIFDPPSGRFLHLSSKDPKTQLKSDLVSAILRHSNGTMWVATLGGLHHYTYEDKQFVFHPIPEDVMPDANQIVGLTEAPDGKLVLATQNKGVLSFDPQTKTFEVLFHRKAAEDKLQNEIRAVFFDSRGRLWIGTNGGLFTYDYKRKAVEDNVFDLLKFDNNRMRVRSIAEDSLGNMWVSIYGVGIITLDAATFRYRHYGYIPSIRHGLSSDNVDKLLFDDSGLLWIGTEGYGVNIWDPVNNAFEHIIHRAEDKNSLSNNVVWAVEQDEQDNLWIGTDKGLNRLSRDGQVTRFYHVPDDENSLVSDLVYNLVLDRRCQCLWIATDNGLDKMSLRDGRFEHFRHEVDSDNTIAGNFIYDIEMDSQRQLWIASNAGLDKMNVDTGQVVHYAYHADDAHSLTDNSAVTKLYIDTDGTLWVGTDNGLNRYNRQNDWFDRFLYTEGAPVNRDISVISAISEVKPGVLWVGFGGDGLRTLDFNHDTSSDKTQPRLSHLTIKEGLPTNLVFGILPDSAGRVWISTMNGFMLYDLAGQYHRFFGAKEGLLSSEFNEGAYYIDKQKKLYFGTTNGLVLVDPGKIPPPHHSASLEFVEMLTYIGRHTLTQPLLGRRQVEMPYEAHGVSVRFSDLNYYSSQPTRFAYQLDTREGKWIDIGNDNTVTLNNLSVGTHEFSIRHKSRGGDWGEVKTLTVLVTAPWWLSWPAYLLYGLAVAAVVALLLRAQARKILRERAINQQLKQVDRLKNEFLANTSHELRTPLNGIIGIAESLLDGVAGELPSKAKRNLALVVSSGKRLANMVNDILDFAKLKDQNLELQMRSVDLRSLADVVLTLSKPLTFDRSIELINRVPEDLPPAYADEDRLQQVLLNLVANGIRFSEKGQVAISARTEGGQLIISVSDNGIGIDPDKLDSIFESFEKIAGRDRRTRGGAGLGLAVSKRLVELHGGKIQVESTPGQGTRIYFNLAISTDQAQQSKLSQEMAERLQPLEDEAVYDDNIVHHPDIDCGRFRILLVDDEPINRRVLYSHLCVYNYSLIEAASGEEALLAMEMNGPFDLVLLDIMMPRMSGYEVCEKLRQKYPVNDLAIIFLTSKSQVADLVQSFAVGANDYLTKPVAKHELLSRVEMHLKMLDINRNLERKVIERTRELEHSNKSITALSEICAEISSMLDMNMLLHNVYDHIKSLMDVDVFCIGLFDEKRQQIKFKLAIECDDYLPPSVQSMDEKGRPAVWCIQHQKPFITNNYAEDYHRYFGDMPIAQPKVGKDAGSLMYWPLIVGEKLIGVLTVQSYHPDAYNEHQQETIRTLASTTAIALDNAKAYREVERKNHEIIAAQQQLVQAEKMVSLGSLTAGVAHEINNPTNFVHVSAQNLEVDLSRFEQMIFDLATDDADEEILQNFRDEFYRLHSHLDTIKDGTERIKIIVQDLRAFTQIDVVDPKTVDITDCLQSTLNLVQTKYLDIAEFITDFSEHPQLLCHPAQLNQVFMNLIVNACDAIREKNKQLGHKIEGQVHVECHLVDDWVEVRIKDNGCGMSEQTKRRLFEPFYTTKAVGEGTGLGLSISFGIVNKHNGELKVESELGVGSEFLLRLPMSGGMAGEEKADKA